MQRSHRQVQRSLAIRAFVALAIAVPHSAVRAQEPAPLRQPDAIPLELASALISAGGFNGQPQFLVGSMPEWLTNKVYVPSNARVLGAAFLGSSVTGVVSLPSTSDSVIAELKRELLKRGWTMPPAMPKYTFGGFNAAPPATDVSNSRATLCNGQQVLSVSAARRGGVATDVTFRLTTTSGISACHLPQMPTPSTMLRTPFPTLINPVGATDTRMTGDCGATIIPSMGTGTTLRTTMPADALLDHFARQLADSGWTSASNASGIISRSYARTDSAGVRSDLTLTVVPSATDASCRDVNLQVRTVRKP